MILLRIISKSYLINLSEKDIMMNGHCEFSQRKVNLRNYCGIMKDSLNSEITVAGSDEMFAVLQSLLTMTTGNVLCQLCLAGHRQELKFLRLFILGIQQSMRTGGTRVDRVEAL
jgi:hypothetical protein